MPTCWLRNDLFSRLLPHPVTILETFGKDTGVEKPWTCPAFQSLRDEGPPNIGISRAKAYRLPGRTPEPRHALPLTDEIWDVLTQMVEGCGVLQAAEPKLSDRMFFEAVLCRARTDCSWHACQENSGPGTRWCTTA